ncbi:hypothetical protein PISMIDRAFT_19273, partial [Pisolithus microcarpus 441]
MSSQQASSSRQSASTSRDLSQAPDEDLEVRTDDSEETERAKEAEKSRREAVKKERRAEEEREKQLAEEAARQAASGRGKGRVDELQREGLLVQTTRMGTTPLYSPTTGAQVGSMAVPIYRAACEECQQQGGERRSAAGRPKIGLRRGAFRGSGLGLEGPAVGRRREAEEGSEMSAPRFEAGGSHLVGERELRQRLPPDDEYHGRLLVAQEEQALALGRQAAAMEQMASAQEAQALAVQV